jgi:hypothetical protein
MKFANIRQRLGQNLGLDLGSDGGDGHYGDGGGAEVKTIVRRILQPNAAASVL